MQQGVRDTELEDVKVQWISDRRYMRRRSCPFLLKENWSYIHRDIGRACRYSSGCEFHNVRGFSTQHKTSEKEALND